MKWRSTVIYLLVLLLVGAAYLVMDRKQKEAARAEKESKRVLAFDPQAVREIEIVRSGDAAAIHLEKGDNWRITQPVAADVDKTVFAHFFSALRDVEQERKIDKPSDNLSAFGLDKPSLVVRLLSGSEWLELRAGGKNPAETSRYAGTGDGSAVFMISGTTYDDLNKGLKDLRRKELFGWLPEEVSSVEVKWRTGEGFDLERQGGAGPWKSVNQPEIEIKAEKVQSLLDELHWLRAVDFVGQDAAPSAAEVEVKLKLKDQRTPELTVAAPDPAKKQLVASSSEIGPVLIAPHILEAIPKSAASLADRSLISSDAEDISQISWKTGDVTGNLARIDSKSWGIKEGDAAPRPIENPLRVKGFLTSLENVEYIEALEPAPNPPEGAPNSVHLVDAVGKKSSLVWDTLPSEAANPVTVWVERDGATRAVKMQYEDMKRLNESLAHLSDGPQGKH